MIRNDWYCNYQGKDYRFGPSDAPYYYLVGGLEDKPKGFEEIGNRYIKHITKEELKIPVDIRTRVIYKNYKFSVIKEIDSQFLLDSGGNGVAAKEAGFTWIEPGVWEKWVDKNDPDLERIYEEVKPLELK